MKDTIDKRLAARGYVHQNPGKSSKSNQGDFIMRYYCDGAVAHARHIESQRAQPLT